MLVLFQDDFGQTFEALLLARSSSRIRIVIPGFHDAVEVEYLYGQWRTEDGRQIELCGLIRDGNRVPLEISPALMAATWKGVVQAAIGGA